MPLKPEPTRPSALSKRFISIRWWARGAQGFGVRVRADGSPRCSRVVYQIFLLRSPTRGPRSIFLTRICTAVSTRCEAYAQSITKSIGLINQHEWKVNVSRITSEQDYSGALVALENDFGDINRQLGLYVRAKEKVAEQAGTISQLTDDNEKVNKELNTLNETYSALDARAKIMEKALNIGPNRDMEISDNLTGEILQVNNEWDFVVVSVGSLQYVPENLKMLVARDDKLIARLQVSKVLSKVCVAEILPEALSSGGVKVGDRVILPKSQE